MSSYSHAPKLLPKRVLRRIKRLFIYNHKNGDVIWRIRPAPHSKKRAGDLVGHINNNGYRITSFTINNKQYTVLAHHIAWFLYYGEWPSKEVDHRNTIRSDNRIKNLRLATRRQTNRNRSVQSNNTSGITGISWRKNRNKYRAYITVKNGTINLGYFNTLKEAIKVRQRAERKYFKRFRYKEFESIQKLEPQHVT
jgi:hypothetical protein